MLHNRNKIKKWPFWNLRNNYSIWHASISIRYMHGSRILTGTALPVGLKKGILFAYDRGILLFRNIRASRIILFILPTVFISHSKLAYIRICHFTEWYRRFVQIVSVSSLKTASFSNGIGEYSYDNIKENPMSGHELKSKVKQLKSFWCGNGC